MANHKTTQKENDTKSKAVKGNLISPLIGLLHISKKANRNESVPSKLSPYY